MRLFRRWVPDVVIVVVMVASALLPCMQSAVVSWLVHGRREASDDRLLRWTLDGDAPAVVEALHAGASPETASPWRISVLMIASARGEGRIVEALIAHGAAVNRRDPAGHTALFYAAGFDRSEIVQLLLSAGADPELWNESGHTAMDVARQCHSEAVVAVLHEAAERAE